MSDATFDLLDKKNYPTGKTASERVVHSQGRWHKSVNLCITDQRGGVLRVHRGAPPYVSILPDVWDFAATGHVLAGESPAEAVAREMHQQLGICRPLADLRRMGLAEVGKTYSAYWVHDVSYQGNGYTHRVVDYNFILPWPLLDIRTLRLDHTQVRAVRWEGIDTIRQNVEDPDALDRVKYADRVTSNAKFYGMMLDAAQERTAHR